MWHPLAAGLAVATLHACYGNELKQFISGITELTPDAVQVLRAADQLEKDLVQIAVEDSVESEDGGKAIIREMPPYEAEGAIANLVKIWIKTRIDRLKEWVDRNLQQEVCIHYLCFCYQLMIFSPNIFKAYSMFLTCNFFLLLIFSTKIVTLKRHVLRHCFIYMFFFATITLMWNILSTSFVDNSLLKNLTRHL